MPNKYPFALRLIGFGDPEANKLETIFSAEREKGYGYFRLLEDNLQDADLYIANGEDIKALVKLSHLSHGEVRPALLIGQPVIPMPHPVIDRPVQAQRLFAELDALVEKRADALARLEASDIIAVPERRRRDRLDLDLTDPAEYQRMRRQPAAGGVLVIDKSAMLRDYLAGVLARQALHVAWVKEADAAVKYCNERQVSVVLINTSLPGIDPYALCQQIKRNNSVRTTSVIMLTGKPFVYEPLKARCAGCDGFLNKPLAPHHLLSALRKFLPSF